jgi:hypothetical protein
MKTQQEILETLAADFTCKTRDNGEKYLVLDENSPLYDVVRECHDSCRILPHDWIFDKVCELVETASGYDNPQDYDHEIIDSCVDIYSNDLLNWAKSFKHYVNEAQEQGLVWLETDLDGRLMAGQYVQLSEFFSSIMALVEEIEEDQEEV